MTKPTESPYQISLDIPVNSDPGQSLLDSDSHPSDSHQNKTLLPHNPADGQKHLQTVMTASEVTEEAHPHPYAVNVTQFSLLDRLSHVQAPQESMAFAEEQAETCSFDNHDSTNTTSSTVPQRDQAVSDIAIGEPYLLPVGTIISSPGGHFTYRILGACCRLFDRNELPWPCCRIQWRSKEPSWRRIGKRLVPDMATKRFSSYMVEIVDHEYSKEPFVLTLYWLKLPADIQNWWCTKYVPTSTAPSSVVADQS